jgi:hypothetical protein
MESDPVLDTLCEILETDRNFFQTMRYLNNETRNLLAAQHMRNTNNAMALLREITARRREPIRQEEGRIVLNIPLGMLLDPSGNFLNPNVPANFMEPVPIVPTRAQIDAAVDTHIHTDATCSICQDAMTCAMQIRACGHMFHGACLEEWFTMNSRCPMCRHDIRDPPTHLRGLPRNTDNDDEDEDDSVHTDEEPRLDL